MEGPRDGEVRALASRVLPSNKWAAKGTETTEPSPLARKCYLAGHIEAAHNRPSTPAQRCSLWSRHNFPSSSIIAGLPGEAADTTHAGIGAQRAEHTLPLPAITI